MINPRTDGKLRDGLWIKQTPSVYSSSQIIRWLSKINYPKADISEHDISTFETSWENLCLLLRLSLVTFPFENTPIHYTSSRIMDISPEGLFQRLVVEKGGNGSYCFGNNGLFLQMIRGLGYRAYPSAGRINEQPPNEPVSFLPFVHMIIFVQPGDSNQTYLVDACGGGTSVTYPILLADGQTVVGTSPTETHTLVRSARSESSLVSFLGGPNANIEWHLIMRHTKGDKHTERVCYSFIEDEFFTADYASANLGVYTKESGFFWENVICSKCFWLTDDEMKMLADSDNLELVNSSKKTTDIPLTQQYMGRLAMEGNTVRRHIGPYSEVIKTMKTEKDRIDAFRDIFGIDIPPQNMRFMMGRVPALNGCDECM